MKEDMGKKKFQTCVGCELERQDRAVYCRCKICSRNPNASVDPKCRATGTDIRDRYQPRRKMFSTGKFL